MQWRDGILVLVSLALGPAIASLIAGLGLAAVNEGSVAAFSIELWSSLLSFAYFAGWVPMTAAGVANALLSRYFKMGGRVLIALPVGALAVVAMLALIVGNLPALSVLEAVIFAIGGAFASHICVAIVELFGPRLQGG